MKNIGSMVFRGPCGRPNPLSGEKNTYYRLTNRLNEKTFSNDVDAVHEAYTSILIIIVNFGNLNRIKMLQRYKIIIHCPVQR